jgi:hypothetical protein
VIFEIAIRELASWFRALSRLHACSLALCIRRKVFELLLHAMSRFLQVQSSCQSDGVAFTVFAAKDRAEESEVTKFQREAFGT